ncbi:MAG: hypothetical protein FJ096_17280 [Deltaproteobacteria bacterium]|nr:hypothetical protein [Deltaproteobacteria bacterium]
MRSLERRAFLRRALGAGTALGVASVPVLGATGGCAAEAAPGDGMTGDATPCEPKPPFDPLAGVPEGTLDIVGAKLPYRQADPAWGGDVMWDRELVIQAATELEGYTQADAESLLREFEDGNTIANEGCMLTCFAMILRLLAPAATPPWTPRTLNLAAQERLYYSPSGLSMTTLFADLLAEVTNGAVQLCLKEEYLPGEPGWPRIRPSTSALVRAYRSLPPRKRSQFLVMVKTGTYDDTVASHYVLLHPDDASPVDEDDVTILDPALPDGVTGPFRLSDSAAAITQDPEIAAGWKDAGIEPTQLGGVWVFARWREGRERSHLDPLVHAWAAELAKLAESGG